MPTYVLVNAVGPTIAGHNALQAAPRKDKINMLAAGSAPAALAPSEIPRTIAPHAGYRHDFAGSGTPDSPYISGWVVDGRSLIHDAEAHAWLIRHGFNARGRRWYRQDMTLGGFLQFRASARSAVDGGETALPPRTPGNWRLQRTSIVRAEMKMWRSPGVLSDDEIDPDGNLTGRGLADGLVLAAAPVMFTMLKLLATDYRDPADLRGYAQFAVATATGAEKPGGVEPAQKKVRRARGPRAAQHGHTRTPAGDANVPVPVGEQVAVSDFAEGNDKRTI